MHTKCVVCSLSYKLTILLGLPLCVLFVGVLLPLCRTCTVVNFAGTNFRARKNSFDVWSYKLSNFVMVTSKCTICRGFAAFVSYFVNHPLYTPASE